MMMMNLLDVGFLFFFNCIDTAAATWLMIDVLLHCQFFFWSFLLFAHPARYRSTSVLVSVIWFWTETTQDLLLQKKKKKIQQTLLQSCTLWHTPLVSFDLEQELWAVPSHTLSGVGSHSLFQQACGRTGNVIAFNWLEYICVRAVSCLCCPPCFTRSASGVCVMPPPKPPPPLFFSFFSFFFFVPVACWKALAGAVTLQEFHSCKRQNLAWPSELPYLSHDPYASCARFTVQNKQIIVMTRKTGKSSIVSGKALGFIRSFEYRDDGLLFDCWFQSKMQQLRLSILCYWGSE